MATLIDSPSSSMNAEHGGGTVDDASQRARSSSNIEPECNNRTSPSPSFAAASATVVTESSAASGKAAEPQEDLWASLEKDSTKRSIKLPSLRGSNSGAGGKWKRRGMQINPADEGMEEWEKVTALVTSSDGANATRPVPNMHWNSENFSASASSFLAPAVAAPVHRRGSIADPPRRRRGVGLSETDDERGGGGDDEEDSSDDDEDDDGDGEEENEERTARRRQRLATGQGLSISRSDDTTLFRSNTGNESGSGGSSRFQRKKEKRESYNRLMELLVKDNLLLLEAICSSVLSHIEDEADVILPELVRFMLSTQVATDIIVRLIRAEVLCAVEEGTILRGNEPISIMLTAHAKIVGHSFLCQMLKPEIALLCDEINQHKLDLEIDPLKMKGKGDTTAALQENVKSLISVAARFLERIKSCLPLCPSQIRHISSEMRKCLMLRFPASTVDSVLGGYIFLRLICPIIVSPDSAGMSGEDDSFYLKDGMLQKDTIRISPEAQRGLILLSKTLQQLANGGDFGWKESYMLPLNSFLQESRPSMTAIFESVATPTADGKNDDAVTLEKGEAHLIKFIFHKLIHAGMDHIEAFVRERQSKLDKSGTAAASEGKSESETKPESELEGEGEAMKMVEELKQVMRALGKPPRSLRKYRDIVFYDERHQPAHKQAHDHSDAKKSKKKLKKSKKEEKKKAKKEKKSATTTKPRGISRLGSRSRGKADNSVGDAVGNKWKSDSCSKVSLVERSSSKRDLKFDAIVRRVRSSDQRTDDGGPNGGGDDDAEGVEGGVISSGDGGAESEEGLVPGGPGGGGSGSSYDDESYSSDFFDESEDEPESPLSSTPSRLNPLSLRSANSSVAEEDMEKEREEKIRRKAEIAKKLLEEKYKSYSMRNLRSERAAMKKERQPLTARGAPSGDSLSQGASKSSTNKKRDGRSITLTDLQVVKRERDNEVLRSVGPLSPRGRNLTSPPAQHHQVSRNDLSSSSSSDSSSEEEPTPRKRQQQPLSPTPTRVSKLGARMPSLRIPTREDFKFLSPRRPSSGRKDDPKHHN